MTRDVNLEVRMLRNQALDLLQDLHVDTAVEQLLEEATVDPDVVSEAALGDAQIIVPVGPRFAATEDDAYPPVVLAQGYSRLHVSLGVADELTHLAVWGLGRRIVQYGLLQLADYVNATARLQAAHEGLESFAGFHFVLGTIVVDKHRDS